MEIEKINSILDKFQEKKGNLISILHEIQNAYNYLPEDELRLVSRAADVPLSRLYSIATFYSGFSLTPKGRHQVKVCCGTACHIKGAERNFDEISRVLGVGEGETTADLNFSLEKVNCLGTCALAPVMVVDEEYYDGVKPSKIQSILKEYSNNDK